MPILNFQANTVGQAGQTPKFIYLNTNDTIATVITPGYLNGLVAQGNPIGEIDMAVVATSITPYSKSVQVSLYDVDNIDGQWSLVPFGTIEPSLNGQVIIGSNGAPAVANTLTAGTGINITNGPGTITISTGGFLPWINVTTPTQVMSPNTSYICNCTTSLIAFILPTVATIGEEFQIVGNSSHGWDILQNASQVINFGNVSTSVGGAGTIASTLQYDCITLVCTVANTTFVVYDAIGNLTVI